MARSEIEDFMAAYKKAVESDMCREDFAAKMGVKVGTVYQRIYDLQKKGLDIPQLKVRRTLPFLDRAAAAWGSTAPTPKAAPKKEAETTVETKAAAKRAVEKPVTPVEPPVPAADVMDEITKLLG